MSALDYFIDIVLIALVFRQIRPRELTLSSLVVPLVLVALAALNYLRTFSLRGNDLLLIVLFCLVGFTLGLLSAIATKVWRDKTAKSYSQAGILAATAWVLGMGFRFAFAVYANTRSGALSIGRFSIRHHISSGQAWTTALVLMAVFEVVARTGTLQLRRVRIEKHATVERL